MATVCSITRSEFFVKAQSVTVTLDFGDGKPLTFKARVKTDKGRVEGESLGWFGNDKVEPCLDGRDVVVQCGLNLTVVKSKELPSIAAVATASAA